MNNSHPERYLPDLFTPLVDSSHDMRLSTILLILTFAPASQVLHAVDQPLTSVDLRQLAENYEHGRGVAQNYQKAYRLYCMAVSRGDVEANYRLGWMYFNRRGVAKDNAMAAGWFKRGADRGDPHAQKMLGVISATQSKIDQSCTLTNPSRDQIEKWVRLWAPEYGLEPGLVLAVISAESNFNHKAKSHKGALGLMQLIPTTAKRFGVNDIFDPADNMHGGMAYLQWLLQHFNGDVQLALAGYNAGENAVERYQGIPPYKETRSYIHRIAKTYNKAVHQIPN